MDEILKLQNSLLSISPGLLPLATLAYSFLNSWHCAVMCGPFSLSDNKKSLNEFLLIRLFSYTLMGAIFGGLGKTLRHSLKFEFLNIFGFLILVAVVAIFVLPQFFPKWPTGAIFQKLRPIFQSQKPLVLRGVLLSVLPCHLLAFYYGVATFTMSPFLGAVLLFGHAVMTTPALAWARSLSGKIAKVPGVFRIILKTTLVALILLNLFYFMGHLFHSDLEVKNKVLFCF